MGKYLIYTAIFGEQGDILQEPEQKIEGFEFACFTDRKDLKSNTWKIIHEDNIPGFFTFTNYEEKIKYTYDNPRLKARIIKTVLPVRLKAFTKSFPYPKEFSSVFNFFNRYDSQIYIWIDGSMQLKQSPMLLIDKVMKEADILAFQHPERQKIELEAKAAAEGRGTNLTKALAQVASYRARGFTWAIQEAITVTGFLFRRHSPEMDYFNLSWISEILLFTERDQLSIDFCIWKHKLKRNFIIGLYRRNPWVKYHPHSKEKTI